MDSLNPPPFVLAARDPLNALRARITEVYRTDEAATVLPVGTPVYEVAGYSTDRRLAAYRNDTLHIYDRDEK